LSDKIAQTRPRWRAAPLHQESQAGPATTRSRGRQLPQGIERFFPGDVISPLRETVRAVRIVAAGDALLAPAVTRRLLDRYVRYLPSARSPSQDPIPGLTTRELAVLRLVSRGLSNDEIAARLHLARSSVKSHVSHLLGKLGRTDRVQLVVLAYESGLVRPGDPIGTGPETSVP
jgi:DNA-binding NarL/FixJ family response regulator